ncbi:MAG: phosphohistidine phosphatase SixA [Spirochaetia bacterium]|jgi:phosphohistidine phosphatase
MEVYFLRHGEAGKSSRGQGGDAARQLTEEGIARMEREAAFISALRLRLDAILTSPLVRAQQTAEIVARELRLLDALAVDERLSPGFGPKELGGIVREHRAAAALMLVGHEPDFSAAIAACIGGGRVECKKGALARVDFDTPDLSSGVLVWLLPPRVLAP